MKTSSITLFVLALFALCLPACDTIKEKYNEFTGAKPEEGQAEVGQHEDGQPEGGEGEEGHQAGEHGGGEGEEGHQEAQRIIVTSPVVEDVISTQRYVCQIHSRRHIEICALEGGYLEAINIREGQTVKQGDVIFKILPILYQSKLDAEKAEAQLKQVRYDTTYKLYEQKIVSIQEVNLADAELKKAQAKVNLTQAELNFADIKAPFDGIVGRQMRQQGSLIKEGDVLTTMSDNALMWVYFNVPEARYLEYEAAMSREQNRGKVKDQDGEDEGGDDVRELDVELLLANHKKFNQPGKIGAIEAIFNNETGNIAFRADFPNPNNLLRHGQTGTILVHHTIKNAVVIPQRATFEVLAKQYVYIVGEDHVVHRSEITVANELDDIFVIKNGVKPGDKIILEGILQVRDDDKIVYDFRDPKEVLAELKNHAE